MGCLLEISLDLLVKNSLQLISQNGHEAASKVFGEGEETHLYILPKLHLEDPLRIVYVFLNTKCIVAPLDCCVRRKATTVPWGFPSSFVSSITWLLVSDAGTLCIFDDIFERRKNTSFKMNGFSLKLFQVSIKRELITL